MSNILMTTGTGELEVMEFIVAGEFYGINVLKLKGIVQLSQVVQMPQRSKVILGVSNIRDAMVPVVDLKYVLKQESSTISEKALALLCEFNGINVAFIVDSVEGIRRLKWDEMQQDSYRDDTKITTGGFIIDNRILLMLDFECIVMEAGLGESYLELENSGAEKYVISKDKHIVFAEDSALISAKVIDLLKSVGYENVHYFPNGRETLDYLLAIKAEKGENFIDYANILISDIEMPIMDGYMLTKFIKEDPVLKVLPVIFFSSLINDELRHKGELVGAQAQICKPSLKELIETIEKYVGGK